MSGIAALPPVHALDLEDLAGARERFLARGEVDPSVRPPVAESWLRSRRHGVHPQRLARQARDPEALERALAVHRSLVDAVEPLLEEVEPLFADLPHLLVLADPDGRVLRLWAHGLPEDTDLVGSNLFEGASWHESEIGCNGIGTALSSGEPVVLVGPEHFQESYVGWTCIGVPLRSPDGTLAGAIDLSVPNDSLSLSSWGWMISLGRRVGQALAAQRPVDVAGSREVARDPLAAVRGALELLGTEVVLPSHRRLLAEAAGQLEGLEADFGRRVADLVAERDRSHEAAQRAEEARALLGHELRTPLAAVQNAAVLLEEADARSAREAVQLIQRQVALLARLAEDLEDLGRLERAEALSRVRLRLCDVVADAVSLMQPEMDARRHAFDVKLPNQPLWIHGDAARLQQVFANLLANAARYTDPGGRVGVAVLREGDEAVVRVCDDGRGIAADHRERIFELFQRAGSRRAGEVGSGIGLALVKKLVELHGGRVSADSEGPGRGSVFSVRLPLDAG